MLIDHLRRYRSDEGGVVAVVVALLLTVLLGFAAIGVDMAALYRERAQLQSVSDLTAMSAAADVPAADARAQHALARNAADTSALSMLETGRYLRNPALPAAERFTVLPTGAAAANAVRVRLDKDAPIYFAQIFTDKSTVTLNRTALATRTGAARFSLGSHLVNLSDDALNGLLAQSFGVGATLTSNDITVLSDVSFSLGAALQALDVPQTRNPAEVLNATTTVGDLVRAAQSVLPLDVANRLDGLDTSTAQIAVAAIVGGIDTQLGLTATGFLADTQITGLDLVRAVLSAQGAQQGIAVTAPVNVAGITQIHTTLTAGEPAAQSRWIAIGEQGAQLHRAALRLKSDIVATPDLLGGFASGIRIASVTLPIYTELAGATASLDAVSCHLNNDHDIAAAFSTAPTSLHPANGTSVVALYLGKLPASGGAIDPATLDFADLLEVDITVPVPLLPDITLAGITIQARGHVAVGASQTERISFTKADLAEGETTKSFGSGVLLGSAIGTLLSPSHTAFRVKPEDHSLIPAAAAPLVADLLQALPARLLAGLATPVDTVLDGTLAAAGVEVGAGELTLEGHHCEAIRLVQ